MPARGFDRGPRRRARELLAGALATAAALLGASALVPATAGARTLVFHASVSAATMGRPIPSDFLGFGLEYRSVPDYVGSPSSPNPVLVQLIRNLAPTGQPVLRIGGQSTDRSWWPVPGMHRPLGVTYDLSTGWAAAMNALAHALSARLILGINLEANSTKLSAYEAKQLKSHVGSSYLDALEIGNEPELYASVPWYKVVGGKPVSWYSHTGTKVTARASGYSPSDFVHEFQRTMKALPRTTLADPSTGVLRWLAGFSKLLSPSSRVKVLTYHAYGLNNCVKDPSSPVFPSIAHLLAPFASRQLLVGTGRYIAQIHRLGGKFRIDEMNSVSCNGAHGVSNTFASALWAMDALFDLASAGVDGANIHTFAHEINAPFDFSRSGGRWYGEVHPLYYGALMFTDAAPAGSRLLRLHSDRQTEVRTWATSASDGTVRVLVINDSLDSPAQAKVKVSGLSSPGSLMRLQASGAGATGGVTLGGQTFGGRTSTGVLGAPQTSTVTPAGGVYTVSLAKASAALLTLKRSPTTT